MVNIVPEDLNFRLIKILDIGFIVIIYSLIAIFVSRFIDLIFVSYNKLVHKDNKKQQNNKIGIHNNALVKSALE